MHDRTTAEDKYRFLRTEAMEVVNSHLKSNSFSVELKPINEEALIAAEASRNHTMKNTAPWNWRDELRRLRRRPRRFELSVWCEGELSALAIGRISDARVVLTLNFVEATHEERPCGSVMSIVLRYLDTLGISLGSRDICIAKPVPSLVDYYRSLGFRNQRVKAGRVLTMVRLVPR